MMKKSLGTLFVTLTIWTATGNADSPIRIGSVASGTLQWELSTIRDQGLDQANSFSIEVIPIANPEAGKIALLGNGVDLIVGDWIWVAGQRKEGHDLTLAPYSTNHGALLASKDSNISAITSLNGKRIGIAGGALDKNWLLLSALAQVKYGINLNQSVDKVFASPPLLNEELRKGKVDAVLTYWNYSAKLQSEGFQQIITGQEIIKGLGIAVDVPSIGYIFRESWANAHSKEISGFLRAVSQARETLCNSTVAWEKAVPEAQENDAKARANLRQRFCDGRVKQFGTKELAAAHKIYELVNTSNPKSQSDPEQGLPPRVFWNPKD